MNVLVVTQQPIPHEGGMSTHVLDLLAGLRSRGHSVTLIEGRQAVHSKVRRALLAAAALGQRDRYRCWHLEQVNRKLLQLSAHAIERLRPDVVHCHDPYAGSALARRLHELGLPLVETVHGPALYEHRQLDRGQRLPRYEALIRKCEQTAFSAAARLIAVDSGQAAILRNDYGVAPERITVIFNSVNVDEVRRLASPDPQMTLPARYFLVPRRLYPKNGVQYAIEALARLPRPDVALIVAGAGPLLPDLQALATRLGLASRVQFLGAVSRPLLLPLFKRAAGVLIPSVPASGVIEATSLAVMEAMAAGSVPIASAIGGLAELIQHDQNGMLVPPADPDDLAAAMSRVLTDGELRARLIATATHTVEHSYSTDAWLRRVEQVYQSASAVPRESPTVATAG